MKVIPCSIKPTKGESDLSLQGSCEHPRESCFWFVGGRKAASSGSEGRKRGCCWGYLGLFVSHSAGLGVQIFLGQYLLGHLFVLYIDYRFARATSILVGNTRKVRLLVHASINARCARVCYSGFPQDQDNCRFYLKGLDKLTSLLFFV